MKDFKKGDIVRLKKDKLDKMCSWKGGLKFLMGRLRINSKDLNFVRNKRAPYTNQIFVGNTGKSPHPIPGLERYYGVLERMVYEPSFLGRKPEIRTHKMHFSFQGADEVPFELIARGKKNKCLFPLKI